eukprot:TRINITY_DN77100_c0_g1_i1.p1 TRINITY_DN77100_c0_g1~~TRINITY_DN77100_c0_g1_i1.p1  ORF type:complete len:136 (-),score=21.46 TRINITY_DN77100_c0_g1_i1:10-417(-)
MCNLKEVAPQLNATVKALAERYNGKPFLSRPQHRFYRPEKSYLSVDLDVHIFSYLARMAFYSVRDKTKIMTADFAILIEGHSDEELPENILGTLTIDALVFHDEYESVPTQWLQAQIGRAVQQECRDRSRMPSSA